MIRLYGLRFVSPKHVFCWICCMFVVWKTNTPKNAHQKWCAFFGWSLTFRVKKRRSDTIHRVTCQRMLEWFLTNLWSGIVLRKCIFDECVENRIVGKRRCDFWPNDLLNSLNVEIKIKRSVSLKNPSNIRWNRSQWSVWESEIVILILIRCNQVCFLKDIKLNWKIIRQHFHVTFKWKRLSLSLVV